MLTPDKLTAALVPLACAIVIGCSGTDGDVLQSGSSSSSGEAGAGGAPTTGSAPGGSGGNGGAGASGGASASGGNGGSGGSGGSSCSNTDTDAHNCGTCGHDCLGGTCVGGACQPLVLATVASTWDLAIDADSVYFNAGSEIAKVKKDGTGEKTLTANPGGACSYGVAVDATDVYWADLCYCAIKKVHKDGTSPMTLANVSCPESITLDGSYVYFVNVTGNIQRVLKAGGAPELVATTPQNGNHSGIVVSGSDVWWTSPQGGTVSHAPKDGSGAKIDFATVQANPTGLAIAGGNAYWLTFDDGGVHQAALGSGPGTAIVSGETDGMKIALAGSRVLWTTYDASGALRSFDGTTASTLASAPNATGLAVDANAIYFASASDGKIWMLAR